MVRTYVAENCVEQQIQEIIGRGKEEVGLIIGCHGNQKEQRDYVAFLATTPSQDDEDAESESEEEVDEKTKLKKEEKQDVELLDEKWIFNHCIQVSRTLPGGFEVIGVYVANLSESQTSAVKNVFVGLFKQVFKYSTIMLTENEKILISISSKTKKDTFQSLDPKSPQSNFQLCELKYQHFVENWHLLRTVFRIHFLFPVSEELSCKSIRKQTQQCFKEWCKTVEDPVVLINDAIRADDEVLVEVPKDKAKQKARERQEIRVSLLKKLPYPDSLTAVGGQCRHRFVIKGDVSCLSYVRNKATVHEAKQAILGDIHRTMWARMELLGEEFEVSESDQEMQHNQSFNALEEINELPKRVFIQHPKCDMLLSDYVFSDESAPDVQERFKQVFGFEVAEEQIDFDIESFPEIELSKNEIIPPIVPASLTPNEAAKLLRNIGWGLLGAVGVGMASIFYLWGYFD